MGKRGRGDGEDEEKEDGDEEVEKFDTHLSASVRQEHIPYSIQSYYIQITHTRTHATTCAIQAYFTNAIMQV